MSFYLFVTCSVILVVTSLIKPHKHSEESLTLVWDKPFRNIKLPVLKDDIIYKVLLVVLLGVFLALYFRFG